MDDVAEIEWVIPCKELAQSLGFYTEQLGFRIDAIFPADAPRVAILFGYGSRIRLEQSEESAPRTLRLLVHPSESAGANGKLVSPDGTRIQFSAVTPALYLPKLQPGLVIHRNGGLDAWGHGRAGMQYRDLVPNRQGGGLIASHIRIPKGGPVPDYVHHHLVLFQVIYCYKGWVKVVYEDQGPEFILREGDCVLQPPGIRHRVLECSDGMEVIELGAPAEHMTFVDHDLILPTPELNPERVYGGQKFVRHEAAESAWTDECIAGFSARETGILEASKGVASLRVLKPNEPCRAAQFTVEGRLQFHFVLHGAIEATVKGQTVTLKENDVFLIPGGSDWSVSNSSSDLELLQLTMFSYSA